MKRRVKTQPTNSFYSNEPAVGRGLIAGKAMSPNAGLANKPPKMVDKNPGRLSGVAGFTSKAKPSAGKTHISIPGVKAAPALPAKSKIGHRIGRK